MPKDSTLGVSLLEELEPRLLMSVALYVSPTGSDANPGTLAQPFATLDKAQAAVRSLKTTSGLPDGGITVYLRGGVYTRSSTFALTSADSGAVGKPIVWTAYNNETVEITGGTRLDPSWFTTVTSSSPIWSRVNSAAKGSLMQVDLKAHGILDYGSLSKRSTWQWSALSGLELFFDGQRMQLGRYPNQGYMKTATAPSSSSFTYSDPRMSTWSSANDVWFNGLFGTLWCDSNVNGKLNTSTKTVTFSAAPQYGVKANMPYFAYNILEEVDTPGEWYLDRNSGMLYFWAPKALTSSNIFASMLTSNVMSMTNTSNVTFQGVTFEVSRGGIVNISGGSSNTLENCVIRDAGTYGAIITGTNNGIDHSQVYDIGEQAIKLDGGVRATLTPAGNFVTNTDIHDYAQWVTATKQGIEVHGVGQIISHNSIHDAPDQAIQFWGNNNLIEYNDIYNVCQAMDDAGAIYSGRDWSYQGNVIRYNFIHDVNGPINTGTGLYGIYLDDAMSQAEIYGNIFYKIGGTGVFAAGGRDIHIYNNMFIDNYTGVLADRRGTAIIDNVSGSDTNFLQKLNSASGGNFHQGAWATAYPNMAQIPNNFSLLAPYMEPGGSTLVGNIGWGNTKAFKREGSWGGTGAYSKWASVTNNLENVNPQLVNEAALDFNVLSSSPVYSIPGWKAIPFDQIGIQGTTPTPPPPPPPPPPPTDSGTVIVDDASTSGFVTKGTWNQSAAVDEYGSNSITSMNVGDSATWTPTLPTSGKYAVYAWWSDKKADGTLYSRDSAAAYSINYSGGSQSVTVDQNVNGGQWNLLGTYNFAAGSSGFVSVLRAAANGTSTVADAVKFVFANTANLPPVANADSATTNQDTPVVTPNVLANDTDPDGDPLTVSAFTQAAHGAVVNNKNGTFTYTPATNYVGADSFTYTVSDGQGGTATAAVNLTVLHVNHAPLAVGDSATTNQDTPVVTANVLANDTDPDGDPLTVSAFTQAAHGTVVNNKNGTFTYTPAAGFFGADSFTYTVSDGQGGTASAAVNLTVVHVNHPPVAQNDSATTKEDTAVVTPNVLANDSDPDGDPLTVSAFTQAAHGTVLYNNNGTFTYTPALLYSGTDSFTYTISDGQGGTAVATVNLTITHVNHAPTANADAATTDQGKPVVTPNVLTNDADVDGDVLSVLSFTQPTHGVVAYNGDGTFTYTSSVNYSGSDSFAYTIGDGQGGTATAPVNLTVKAVSTVGGFLPATVTVDNKTPGYTTTGTWNESAAIDEYNGSSVTAMQIGATAKWTPTLPSAGSYMVYAWWSDKKADGTSFVRDSAANYTIHYNGGTAKVTVDQNLNSGQWVLLGSYNFAAGTGGYVDLVRDTASGISTAADAVRFVQVTPLEVVVDNKSIGFSTTGTWTEAASVDKYNASALSTTQLGATAKWVPTLPQAGTYEVWVWQTAKKADGTSLDLDSAANYTVKYNGGTRTVSVDQDLNSGQWVLLGSFQFAAGATGSVDLVRDLSNGLSTVADAVRFRLIG